MKIQLGLLFLFSSLFSITGQKNTIYYGSPITGGAEIHLRKNNTYNIKLEHGDYGKIKDKDEDFLFLYNLDFQHEGFRVTEDLTRKMTDSITIHFMISSVYLDKENIFIGYKSKEENNIFKYVNLCYETLLFNTNNTDPTTWDLSFKIPRTEELELILKKGVAYIDRFKLSPNSKNVYIDYRYTSGGRGDYSKLPIAGINSAGEFSVDDRLFSTDNPPSNYVKRIASDSIADWEVPFEVEQEAYKKFDDPELKYQPLTTISPRERSSDFPELQSLDEAISKLKNDDSKILLIFNSLLGNNNIHYFHDVFDNVNRSASLDYLSHYCLDRYILYFAKPEDLKEVKKYKSEGVQEVIAINSDLEVVYKENIGAKNFYYEYSSISEELSLNILATNALCKFNKRREAKTLTAKDFLDLGKWRYNDIVIKAIDTKLNEESGDFYESIVTVQKTKKPSEKRFKTKIDFYYPDIHNSEIKEGLRSVIEKHKSDQIIDIDFAKLAYDFISNNFFFNEIAGVSNIYKPEKEHYEFCLYLSRFPIETEKIQNEFTGSNENHYFTILNLLKEEGTKMAYPGLLIPTFENLVQMDKYKYHTIFIYYFYLFNQDKLLFTDFDSLFKEIIPHPNNYVDQLKTFWSNCEYCPYKDDFEYYMITLSNAMAWQALAKHSDDKALLNRALEWSKFTIEASPETHHYIDTYARLEYFLGNKKKAMEMKSKAIRMATEDDN